MQIEMPRKFRLRLRGKSTSGEPEYFRRQVRRFRPGRFQNGPRVSVGVTAGSTVCAAIMTALIVGTIVAAIFVEAGAANAQTADRAAAAGPAVTGPITSGSKPNAFMSSMDDLKARGYMEEEFFVEGNAEGKIRTDDPVSSRAYKTRILVRRPIDAKRFKGTVLVEWLNNANAYDSAPSWPILSDLLTRDGYAWVGVSVQAGGVNFLRKWDPQRYGSLAHPGTPPPPPQTPAAGAGGGNGAGRETYSDTIFSQVGTKLHHPADIDPLGGLKVQRVLAYAFSAGAVRMASYINAAAAREHAYDGFLLQAVMTPVEMQDVGVPIFVVNSENEVSRYLTNRQADSKSFREWEVAGAGHLPRTYIDAQNMMAARDGVKYRADQVCDLPAGVVGMEYVVRAALFHLNEWVKAGKEPPPAPVITLVPGPPATIARDKFGNALGGIRLPYMEAPQGKYVATGTPAQCALVPAFVAFDAATLGWLYPDHKAYVADVSRAADRDVKDGFLLVPEAKIVREEAASSAIGKK
jgi:hypothetical protein